MGRIERVALGLGLLVLGIDISVRNYQSNVEQNAQKSKIMTRYNISSDEFAKFDSSVTAGKRSWIQIEDSLKAQRLIQRGKQIVRDSIATAKKAKV